MAAIEMSRAHTMELDALRDAVERLLEEFSEEHPGLISNVDWVGGGSCAKAKGKGFTATFRMDASSLGIEVELGLLAKAFKGRIQEGLERKMNEILGTA